MGHEYKVYLDAQDCRYINESVAINDPKSVDELLKTIPGYIGGTAYEYKTDQEGWNPSIFLVEDGLHIVIYGREDFEPIIHALFKVLMELCGRFSIEEQ